MARSRKGLPKAFGPLWYGKPDAITTAIGCAEHCSRSHNAVISVYDEVGNVIEGHESHRPIALRTFRELHLAVSVEGV